MYEIRTDLALEAHEINAQAGREDGIRTEEETIDGFSITTVHVGEGEGERLAKKKAGTYINVDVGKSWLLASEGFAALVALLAGQLRKLFPADFSGTALVVGLGNYDITADSIGPKAVEKVVVTRHLRTLNPQLYESAGFGDLCAFAPGVLGQTGMESAEIVRSIVEAVRPSLIVAIDALASRRLARLATTVQLCDTGIYPGAGVSNRRSELSAETLGVPVISIGVPTVVDAATLALDIAQEAGVPDLDPQELLKSGGSLIVTPKDIDRYMSDAAKIIGYGINLALHDGIDLADIDMFLS